MAQKSAAKKKTKVSKPAGKAAGPKLSKQTKAVKGSGKFKIRVENVVSFASLGVPIPLVKMQEVENTEYEPEQFPGLVYRITDPRAAALVFSSGKIVCTGAKSIDFSKTAMCKVTAKIKEIGVKVPKKFDIIVENIVASTKIKAEPKLNLEDIAHLLENAEYEPEQFPGLVCRITDPRVAFLLFSSGKIICTGAHSLEDVNRALAKFKEKLEEIGMNVVPVDENDKPVM